MNQLGSFIRGNGLQKSQLTDSGTPAIHYGQIHTIYSAWTSKTISFTTSAMANKLRRAKMGDLIIATTSEDDSAVAKATAWLGEEEVAISGDAYIYSHKLYPKYVSYFFQSQAFQSQKKKYITGTKVRRISGSSMGKILIPVPPLSEQEKIAETLDGFQAFVNDLTSGLPAEIAARRKQYEYYRDKLLTFEELK